MCAARSRLPEGRSQLSTRCHRVRARARQFNGATADVLQRHRHAGHQAGVVSEAPGCAGDFTAPWTNSSGGPRHKTANKNGPPKHLWSGGWRWSVSLRRRRVPPLQINKVGGSPWRPKSSLTSHIIRALICIDAAREEWRKLPDVQLSPTRLHEGVIDI